jgi:hypothetical protein
MHPGVREDQACSTGAAADIAVVCFVIIETTPNLSSGYLLSDCVDLSQLFLHYTREELCRVVTWSGKNEENVPLRSRAEQERLIAPRSELAQV